MEILYPVTAIHRGGKTVVLDNVEAIRDFVRNKKVGPEWSALAWTFGHDWQTRLYSAGHYGNSVDNDWILRDDRGRSVDPRADPITYTVRFVWERISRSRTAAAKGLPIPHTGKRKRRKHGGCHCDYCTSISKKRALNILTDAENNARENEY